MLTLCTLLPSDNEALLGRSNGFYAPLLIPSDNVAAPLGRSNAFHYIECASNIIPKYISFYYVIPEYNISYYIIPKYNIQYDKVCISGSILYACATPPTQKIWTLLFYQGDLQICHRLN
jgi:hypothetical protein